MGLGKIRCSAMASNSYPKSPNATYEMYANAHHYDFKYGCHTYFVFGCLLDPQTAATACARRLSLGAQGVQGFDKPRVLESPLLKSKQRRTLMFCDLLGPTSGGPSGPPLDICVPRGRGLAVIRTSPVYGNFHTRTLQCNSFLDFLWFLSEDIH